MQQATVQITGLSELTRTLIELPGVFARARKSALSSTGFMIMQELRNHIEYGGSGWAPLHPITMKFRKRRGDPPSPLFFLGRFARYLVDPASMSVRIGLGKGGAKHGTVDGKSGTSLGFSTYTERNSAWLNEAVKRAEHGARTRVTKKVRLLWLATKIKGKKWTRLSRSGAITGGYFVLRPDTEYLTIPRRPIFASVFAKIRPKALPFFEAKFHEALLRYQTGGTKK